MKYVERISHKLVNNVQRAMSYVEMGNKERALDALRAIARDTQELIKASVIEHEQAS